MSESPTIAPSAYDPNVSSLTDQQEVLMSTLGVISGCLSFIGSSLIVYRVVKNRHEGTNSYDRLMLGLSLSDLVASFTFGFGPLLLPKDSSTRAWASGSDATCTLLGFTSQFSFCAVVYNGLLSVYYLLTVRFGVKKQVFATRYEPYFHAVAVLFFLLTSLGGVFIGLYSELEITQGCWIGEYPENCEADDSCVGTLIGWIFGGLPTLFTFFSLPINNIVIFVYVRRNLSRATMGGGNEEQWLRIREVAIQGLLYVGCFYLSFTPAFIIRVLEGFGLNGEKEQNIYPVLLMNSILLPLQGFFNVFIYARPNFNRVRLAYPEQPTLWMIKHALVESDIPTLSESRNLFSTQFSGGRNSGGRNSSGKGSIGKGSAKGKHFHSMSLSRSLKSNLDPVMEDSHEDSSISKSFRDQRHQPSRKGNFADPSTRVQDQWSEVSPTSMAVNTSGTHNNSRDSTADSNSLRVSMDGSIKSASGA